MYEDIQFPTPPHDRPYIVINMIATIDGKTVSGERDENVMDLGSKHDHETMRNIERTVDGVMIGASTLRATKNITYDKRLFRIVVANRTQLSPDSQFFTESPEKAFVITNENSLERYQQQSLNCHAFGNTTINFLEALHFLRNSLSIKTLLVEGGSELNASLLAIGVVDELFLTVAPKIKLGRNTPTYAGGEPLTRDQMLKFKLISCKPQGDEVFLRYVRADAN